ncbi:hypothetical protein FRC07_009603 [Ceratobasidium sp. 392]|nr:hypothetical protein FRC07_009603 [Ceratobasidium sp. 392]
MRTTFVALLSFVAGSLAYQVTSPASSTKWYSGQVTNPLTWERVDTDPKQFTIVLTNQDRSLLPTDQQLIATVDGTTGKTDVPAPSGGFPPGKGFQINLVKSPSEMNTILAQSPVFEIVSGISTSSGTMSSTAVVTSSASRSTVVVAPTTTSPTMDGPNATGAPSSPNGAMAMAAHASPILGACAIFALFLA